jgi:hypothetical protein
VDPAAGDFRLRAGSPLIDAGWDVPKDVDPAQLLDLAGTPRFTDGDGDGKAQLDVGAYEFQPMPAEQPPVQGGQGGGGSQTPAEQPGQHTDEPVRTPAGAGPAPSPLAAPLRLTLAGKALRINRNGRATLSVRCQADSPCRLSVTLTARVRGRTVILARAGATPGKATTSVPLRLSRRALALVRRYRIRSVKAAVTAEDGSGSRTQASRAYALRIAR